MSKVVIYVLDKIVWMLLITAVTTQALQIAGVVEGPKGGLGDITYQQDNEYNFQVQVGDADVRGKRQTEQRSQFIDSLFQVPIQTLAAVNNLVQSSRPAFRSLRDYAMKRFEKSQNNSNSIQAHQNKSDESSNSLIKKLYPVFLRPKEETTTASASAKN